MAREAAAAAARELGERFGRHEGVRAKSTPTDLVSDADLAAESAIRSVLASRRPDDAILGEEGGATPAREHAPSGTSGGARGTAPGSDGPRAGTDGRLRWIVDPLDGTVNFLFGIPVFAVSVACEDSSGTVAGVVLDPVHDECFEATRSGPAILNDEEIVIPERASRLEFAMVATGFGYEAAVRSRQAAIVSRVLPRARDIRRAGAAALDLCWCACGRYDAYYERGLKTWDLAAGALVAERTGLVVRGLPEEGEDPAGVVVAPPDLVDELYELVRD